jgi:hypothetical protein
MRTYLPLLGAFALLANSCAAAGAAIVIGALLNDAAPSRVMNGTVTNADSSPAAGLLVQMKASVAGDDDTIVFSDDTDAAGAYSIKFKWNNDVSYSVRVVDGETELFSEELGKIEKVDFVNDIQLP